MGADLVVQFVQSTWKKEEEEEKKDANVSFERCSLPAVTVTSIHLMQIIDSRLRSHDLSLSSSPFFATRNSLTIYQQSKRVSQVNRTEQQQQQQQSNR